MPEPTDRLPHLLVLGRVTAEEFHRVGGGKERQRSVDRRPHGEALVSAAADALSAQDELRQELDNELLRGTGSIIVVEGAEAVYPLKLESLDRARGEWRLLSVQAAPDGTESAVVWVSDHHRARFLQLFEHYLDADTRTGKPKNATLVANIGRIRAALLTDLWQSDGTPPEVGSHWWEIWLNRREGAEAALQAFAGAFGLDLAANRMELDQRIIRWVRGRWADLTLLPATAVPVSEIRRGQFLDTVHDLEVGDQQALVSDLASRLTAAGPEAPAVCLLDTGTRRTHSLLEHSLDPQDWHTITPDPPGDFKGHGTSMAGLALLGPLEPLTLNNNPVRLLHRLESVKLLPDHTSHDPKTYGLVTAQAVSAPEVVARRRRTYCMPITAPHERGPEPSLWSASLDALAVGTDIGMSGDGIELIGPPDPGAARLVVVSAGNVALASPPGDYLDQCDLSVVEDPAQAWNALVVGAYTNLTTVPSEPSFAGWSAVAPAGELSPHSRTGLLIPPKWPIRPDICMEGGNVLANGTDINGHHPGVALGTPGHRDNLALTTANATSAATAQASRLAARAMARYPDYWPETVRGLVVHGAEWTPPMLARMLQANTVAQKQAVLGRYGWGVPDEKAVLTSSNQAVTMVVQDDFLPFTGSAFRMRQFRLHELPWPGEVLSGLGPAEVRLKVTLSYFIEPSAPRRGWNNRYTYASHGLRFELKNPIETTPEFVKRVNREASREESGGGGTGGSGVDRWLVGPVTRNRGSLHQDIWTGSGADLAACGVLAVHPVGGWWKNGHRKDRQDLRVRYALLISLTTRAEGVDIYTPVANQIQIPITTVSIEV